MQAAATAASHAQACRTHAHAQENARAERERLARENREQTELIERLIFRVDKLEDLVGASRAQLAGDVSPWWRVC